MLGRLLRVPVEERSEVGGFDQYLRLLSSFTFNGFKFITPGSKAALDELTSMQAGTNAIVGACVSVRALVFSEARFQFQRFRDGRPGDVFGTPDLAALESPWRQASTGDLLARMEVDVSLCGGNSYWVRGAGELLRLDPYRVMIVTGSYDDPLSSEAYGQTLVGYAYVDKAGKEIRFFTPDEVAHYRPLPDPEHPFRGRSWLSTVATDALADEQMTVYKHSFLRNAATPNLVVSFDPNVSVDQFEAFKHTMTAGHAGADKAFKTLFLGGGAKVSSVGSNLNDLSVKAVQGAGETRIAAAAGVPASILGISEGLAGSALNSGNYTAARRRFADGTVRPLWRSACAALETLVPPPSDARLWYDDRDISFLQEDMQDRAEILSREASTIESLIRSGYTPDSARDAVVTGDLTRLVHTGLVSVQLQPPGTTQPSAPAA